MTPDWREAAKGIPVWVGCRAFSGRHDFVSLFVVEVGPSSTAGLVNPAVPAGWPGGGGSGALTSSWFPDLSDPDTRAAYDRRLALALDVPIAEVDIGVTFSKHPTDPGWWMANGGGWTRRFRDIDTTDMLLARALAWPADKRVRR